MKFLKKDSWPAGSPDLNPLVVNLQVWFDELNDPISISNLGLQLLVVRRESGLRKASFKRGGVEEIGGSRVDEDEPGVHQEDLQSVHHAR